MVEVLFPVTLRQDMRDGLLDLPSLGQAAGVCNRSVKVRYICLPIYHNRWSGIRQALKNEYLYSIRRRHPRLHKEYSMVGPPTATNPPSFLRSFVPFHQPPCLAAPPRLSRSARVVTMPALYLLGHESALTIPPGPPPYG